MIKIALHGAHGKMGREILHQVELSSSSLYKCDILLDSNSSLEERAYALQNSDIVIDFTNPQSLAELLDLMSKLENQKNAALLVGTTGLGGGHMVSLRNLSATRAVLYTQNTSISANIVAHYAGQITKHLQNYDIEIVEAHHKEKKDAPSGTAFMIGHEIAKVRNIHLLEKSIFARYHATEPRQEGEIGFSSIRGGGITGEHNVLFIGESEMVTLGCRSFSRKLFAEGALLAAKWLVGQPSGFYSMKDVLGLPASV